MTNLFRKVSIATALVVILLAQGCASMKHNYSPEVAKTDFPPLDVVTTVSVGDEMLIQGKTVQYDVLSVESFIDGACYDIPPGNYKKTGSDNYKDYYTSIGDRGSINRSGLCDPISGIFVSKNDPNKVCVLTVFGGYSCYDGLFSVKKKQSTSADAIQRTLLFSGKDKNRLNFLYTERSGLQTLHSHNVSYDADDSATIGYRGAKIQVISSDNQRITYKVLSNFPDREAN